MVYLNEVAQQYKKLENKKLTLMQTSIHSFFRTDENKWFFIILLILIIVPITIFMLILLYKTCNGPTHDKTPPIVKTTNDTIVSYLMTYVIPFATMDSTKNPISILSSFLLFFTVLILFVRLDAVYLNPPLILLGFNIYTDTNDEKKYMTRNSLTELQTAHLNEESLRFIRLTNNFFYISKYKP